MGQGRKSIPNEVKILRGTDQPVRMKQSVDVPKIKSIDEIVNVSKLKVLKSVRAKKIFKDKANQLIGLNILSEIDFEQLAIYAHSLDVLFECMDKIDEYKFKEVITAKGIQIVTNPYLKLYREMNEICSKIGSDFGFSPVSRMKLHTKSEEKDPLQELMNQFKS